MSVSDDLREWIVLFDQRAMRIKNGALPSAIHFSEQLRNDLEEAVKEMHRLRAEIKERDRQGNEGYLLSEDSQRHHRFMNCLDIDDLDERAERLMQSQFDGVIVGPGNRATIKATISQHFHAIRAEQK